MLPRHHRPAGSGPPSSAPASGGGGRPARTRTRLLPGWRHDPRAA